MDIRVVQTSGLGDSTYVLSYEGQAVVVDPQRDIDRFEAVLNESGSDLRFVLETHLHNDYVSGGRYLAKAAGGEVVLPAGAAPAFRHRPAYHSEDLDAGSFVVRPIHTPGHTPEHTSYLIVVDGIPVAVFSGGSLLVGSAGRSDLLGMERADTLARLQYRSVSRLAALPDAVGLYPTHGAGSFCTASGTGEITSTIGTERVSNPVLSHDDEDSFVTQALSGLVPYPAYYRYMGPTNVTGALPMPALKPPMISATDLEAGVDVIDMRPKVDVAAGHLPGSLAIEERNDFGVWVGWVVAHNAPLYLVANPGQDTTEAVRQLARIGFDDVRGVVTDLSDVAEELVTYRLASVDEFKGAVSDGAQILDVRAPNEWDLGIIDDSTRVYVPDVVASTPGVLDPTRPVWVACETGYRASIVATTLEQRGFEPVVLAEYGVTDVLSRLSNH
ncbi:MAG: MBL fold metallo-hydrolase [Actinomycetota bacterium]|nr:MBL fold metallo-hydrolase [Actinomycetota bacterium]